MRSLHRITLVIIVFITHTLVAEVNATTRNSDSSYNGRYIELDGTLNFRDIGGLETKDGRFVKRDVLYRSDKLSELTERDLSKLKSMNIQYVVDFRSPREQQDAPDKIDALSDVTYHHLPLYTKDVPVTMLERIIAMLSVDDMSQVLVESNKDLVRESTDEYKEWFALLLKDENTPMIFHCSGGKDRTGLATALLLSALDVPREEIFEDYLATNDFVRDSVNETLDKISFYTLGFIHPDRVRPVMMVDRKYLTAAFTTIDEMYGGIDTYLDVGLGLNREKREQLKSMYTVSRH